jgi:hypothetical protein
VQPDTVLTVLMTSPVPVCQQVVVAAELELPDEHPMTPPSTLIVTMSGKMRRFMGFPRCVSRSRYMSVAPIVNVTKGGLIPRPG